MMSALYRVLPQCRKTNTCLFTFLGRLANSQYATRARHCGETQLVAPWTLGQGLGKLGYLETDSGDEEPALIFLVTAQDINPLMSNMCQVRS